MGNHHGKEAGLKLRLQQKQVYRLLSLLCQEFTARRNGVETKTNTDNSQRHHGARLMCPRALWVCWGFLCRSRRSRPASLSWLTFWQRTRQTVDTPTAHSAQFLKREFGTSGDAWQLQS